MAQTRPRAVIPTCFFAWLLPGAGHLFQGRTSKGLFFLVAIGALFVLGVAMDARLQSFLTVQDGRLAIVGLDDPLALLRSLAQLMVGLPFFLARSLGLAAGTVTSATHEYGNTFTEVGGLLNVLIILDAHDIAVGRKA